MTQIFRRSAKWLLISGLFLTGSAWSFGLQEAYRAALDNDPQYRAARHELDASRQAEPMAFAGLMPRLSFSAGATKYSGDREISGSISAASTEKLDYTSRQNALNLQIPIYNLEAIVRYRQAGSQVAYSESLFSVRGNELVTRLAGAFFDLQLALYNYELAQAQVDAFQEQAKLAARLFKGGEGTRTEVAESESLLDISLAQLIESKDQLDIARRSLKNITGLNPDAIQPLRRSFLAQPPQPTTLEQWVELAGGKSPLLAVRRQAVETAKQEVSRNQAGHAPRVDYYAAYSRSASDSINTINQQINTVSSGIQLTIPLYSGGYVNAATDQALASLKKAEADLDNELSNVQIEIRRQFLATSNGPAKIEAYLKAVKSSEVALDGTRYGLKAGTRTNVDVLDAQRRVFSAKRDLAQARYTYLLASLKLKSTAGVLIEDDLSAIDRLLFQP